MEFRACVERLQSGQSGKYGRCRPVLLLRAMMEYLEMGCERPPRSLRSRLPLTRGRLDLFSPSVRGRAAEGGRGSLKHHLEDVIECHVSYNAWPIWHQEHLQRGSGRVW